ncbi:hypothetical protein GP486_008958, partial [Trichoglossum hirsutum]
LEKQLDEQESERNKSQRSVRNVDRTVRDLQAQIDRRDKINAQLEEEISKSRDKADRLLQTIEELQSSDSANQLAARRAERELREEKENALRLERELEGWKGLRLERGVARTATANTLPALSEDGGDAAGGECEEPVRKRSVPAAANIVVPKRMGSNSKGFL